MITREWSPDKDENIGYSVIAQVIRDRCCATCVSPLLPCVCPPCTAHLTCSNRWNIALLLVTQCLVIPVFPLPFPVLYVSQQLHFKLGRDPIWALCHIISTVCTVNLASLFFSHCYEEVLDRNALKGGDGSSCLYTSKPLIKRSCWNDAVTCYVSLWYCLGPMCAIKFELLPSDFGYQKGLLHNRRHKINQTQTAKWSLVLKLCVLANVVQLSSCFLL